MEYTVFLNNEKPEFTEQAIDMNNTAWPAFVAGEKVMKAYWGFMLDKYPDHQLMLAKGNDLIAAISSAAFFFDGSDETISSKGIYWALKKVSHDYFRHKPNTLVAFQVLVSSLYQKKGVSYLCVGELKRLGNAKGYARLVIPLRPSLKHLYPLISMEQYYKLCTPEGLPFDPWLRVHAREGARLVKVCNGISVVGSKEEWERWTEMKIPCSGQYIIPGALNPVYADLEKNMITYEQENVWAIYDL